MELEKIRGGEVVTSLDHHPIMAIMPMKRSRKKSQGIWDGLENVAICILEALCPSLNILTKYICLYVNVERPKEVGFDDAIVDEGPWNLHFLIGTIALIGAHFVC